MRENLERADWSKFGSLKVALLQKTDQMLARDVPQMMKFSRCDNRLSSRPDDRGCFLCGILGENTFLVCLEAMHILR